MDGGSWHCTGDRDQDHPHGKEMKKAKWLSEEALQIAVKRREVESKGKKERHKHLNAEFQRTARRDKKAFLTNQCKVIEENNRMGKTRDLFKKIRNTKGTFHAKMGSIKDWNGVGCQEPAWGALPMAKVMRTEAQHTQRWDRASGVPLEILEHLPPKPESAYFTDLCSHLHLWPYWGLFPTTVYLSEKELTYSSS